MHRLRRRPVAPFDIVAIATSASSVRLYWRHEPGNEEGFVILRRRPGVEWTEIGRVGIDVRQFESTGLLAGETVEHGLRSFNGVEASAETLSPPVTTPSAPTQAHGRIIAPRTGPHPRAGEGSIARVGASLLYVYGRYEGSGDYAWAGLMTRRSHDDGETWSDETALFEGDHQLALPSLLTLTDGALVLSYVVIVDESHATRVVRRSEDQGRSWGDPVEMTDGVRTYMTGSHDRMRQLGNGRLIYPVHAFLALGELATFVYVSDDGGRTWMRSALAPLRAPGITASRSFQYGFWEAAVCEVGPGWLLMVGRTAMGRLYRALSTDFGSTWSQPEPMSVLSPTAPPNIIQIAGGLTLMVWQPHVDPGGVAGGPRLVLASMVSPDAGLTWSNYRQIDYDGRNWFSYASLYDDLRGSVHLTYYGENDGVGNALGAGNIFGGSRYRKIATTWLSSDAADVADSA